MKSAILFGASGLVGSSLLSLLLENPAYDRVTIVVRRPLPISHPKMTMLIGDLDSLPTLDPQIHGDEIYISLGSTKKKTPDTAEYFRIDHDYPVLAARIAKKNGATKILLVSAIDANANSGIFYVSTKGKTENDILALDFAHTHIFRPSMLVGPRKESRPLEKFFIGAFGLIGPLLLGRLKKYRSISTERLAKAMIAAAADESVKQKWYHWQDITALTS